MMRRMLLGLLAVATSGLAQQLPAPPAAPCAAQEYHQLDFWVGRWEVYPTGKDQLVAHIRAQAGQLKFGSTTAAAYHSRAHRNEIPESRRESRAFVANYHAAATTVVKDGDAKFFPMPGDARQVRFIKVTTDDAGLPVTLTVMVYARADGRVVMATFGSFLKND